MADQRFLILRLGSLGDIVHTLPAASALRESFPRARLDWVVDRQWRFLLEGDLALDNIVTTDRASWRATLATIRTLRSARYTCAADFQGLYKSAALALLSGAAERVGFDREFARERGASRFYTRRVVPAARHIVEQNLALAESLGARSATCRFPLTIPAEAQDKIDRHLASLGLEEFYVISPGGGWGSKCWPAERYGHLHRKLAERYGWRGLVNFGSGERAVAEAVRLVAGEPEPVILPLELPQLMAVLRRAKFLVGGDTGPLHLAVALGTPVVGLYGPTDPQRNGPFSRQDVVVCNARPGEMNYRREREYSPAMLSITIEQALGGIEQRLRQR